MLPTQDLLGRRFGKLVVTSFAGYFPTSFGAPLSAAWICRCQCGNTKRVFATNLISGKTRSCGCLRKQKKRPGYLKRKWRYERNRDNLCEAWVKYEMFESFMEKAGYTDRMLIKPRVKSIELSPNNFYFE